MVALLKADADWVPSAPGTSLYIRPTMISTDVMLGRTRFPYIPLLHYLFALRCVLRQGAGPVGIYVEPELVRAVKGGVGFTKTGATMRHLFSRVISLRKKDMSRFSAGGKETKYIEEVGSMNIVL